jgi:hypothetical protein
MARSEMNVRPASVASHPQYVVGRGQAPSQFRDSLGEVWVREDMPKPMRHRGRTVLLIGLALAVMAVGGMKFRKQALGLLAKTTALSHPSFVRVNFNSDPDGATVVQADGTVLGVTPLSVDVAFGDKPIGYVIRLSGYRSLTTSIVPNLPSPVFAVLKKAPPVPEPEPLPTNIEPAMADVPVPAAVEVLARKRASAHSAQRRSAAKAAQSPQERDPAGDEPLQPSEP